MKTFSEGQGRPPVERSRAWVYLVLNVLVLPGLGTFRSGHRVAGALQIFLAFLGFGVIMAAVVQIALLWAPEFEWPSNPFWYRVALAGGGCFLGSWCWSLLSSLALLRTGR